MRELIPVLGRAAFARVQITFTVPSGWATVSNMPVAQRPFTVRSRPCAFRPTPKMPSYLVEFSGGDLGHLSGHSGATALGVWAVRGQEGHGRYALDNAAQIWLITTTTSDTHSRYPSSTPSRFPAVLGAMGKTGEPSLTWEELLLLSRPVRCRNSRSFTRRRPHEMRISGTAIFVTVVVGRSVAERELRFVDGGEENRAA